MLAENSSNTQRNDIQHTQKYGNSRALFVAFQRRKRRTTIQVAECTPCKHLCARKPGRHVRGMRGGPLNANVGHHMHAWKETTARRRSSAAEVHRRPTHRLEETEEEAGLRRCGGPICSSV